MTSTFTIKNESISLYVIHLLLQIENDPTNIHLKELNLRNILNSI